MTARPAPATLNTVFTIAQVAKMAGWSTRRMRRHLLAKHHEMGGKLLHNVSRGKERPRWTITLRALQAIAPAWFLDPEALQRQIEWLTDELTETQDAVATLGRRVAREHERMMSLITLPASMTKPSNAMTPVPRRD